MIGLSALLLSAVWYLLLAWRCSRQEWESLSGRVRGHFLEIAIYRDQPRQLVAALASLVWASLRLGLRLLVPAALLLPLAAPVWLGLEARYARRPLQAQESCLLSLRTKDRNGVHLLLPEGVVEEVAALWVAEKGETFWRVRAQREGHFHLEAQAGALRAEATLQVGQGPITPGGSLVIHYPPRVYWIGDHACSWRWPFLASLGLISLLLAPTLPSLQRWLHRKSTGRPSR